MIIINEDALIKAADAVSECVMAAKNVSDEHIAFKIDMGMIRRGILCLIAQHHTNCDYAIGVMVERSQFVHQTPEGEWIAYPPSEK